MSPCMKSQRALVDKCCLHRRCRTGRNLAGWSPNLEYEIAKARVSVVRNVEVTEEMLLEEQPDAVIIATRGRSL